MLRAYSVRIYLVYMIFWKPPWQFQNYAFFLDFLVILISWCFFLVFVVNVNALSGILLEQGFFYCFLLYPPTPCILLLPRIFHLVPLRKTLCQRQERGLLFCFSATYIYLFIPLIAIMMPIHSYHNSPAFSADGWCYLQPSGEKKG